MRKGHTILLPDLPSNLAEGQVPVVLGSCVRVEVAPGDLRALKEETASTSAHLSTPPHLLPLHTARMTHVGKTLYLPQSVDIPVYPRAVHRRRIQHRGFDVRSLRHQSASAEAPRTGLA